MSVWVNVEEDLKRQGSGRVQATRPFDGQARVKTAFDQEHTLTTQTVPFAPTRDTAWGKVRLVLSFVELPGEHNLVIFDQETLREVSSTDIMTDSR